MGERCRPTATLLTVVLLLLVQSVCILAQSSSNEKADCFRIVSYNFASFYWSGSPPRISENALDTYRVVEGLAGGNSVSFESCDFPNMYIRVDPSDRLIYLSERDTEQTFANQASFRLLPSKWFPNYFALESIALPNSYMRHQGYRLKAHLEDPNSVQLFRADASFSLVEPRNFKPPRDTCMKLISYNFPNHAWTLQGRIDAASSDTFKFVDARNGEQDAISIESCDQAGTFMYVRDDRAVAFGQVDTDDDAWATRASFRADYGRYVAGFVVFESMLFPGSFLRHQGFVLRAHTEAAENELYRNDASFFAVWEGADEGDGDDSMNDDIGEARGLLPNWVQQDLEIYYSFDEGQGLVVKDLGPNGVDGRLTSASAAKWVEQGVIRGAMDFETSDATHYLGVPSLPRVIADNFTISVWVKPGAEHEIDIESVNSVHGLWNQRYVLYPQHGAALKGEDYAGVGLSVGTNGVSVYAHSSNYMPSLLSFSRGITEWTSVVVVVSNDRPQLYINGQLAHVGITSPRHLLLDVVAIGSSPADIHDAAYVGLLDEFRIYNRALSPFEVEQLASSEQNAKRCFLIESNNIPGATWSRQGVLDPNTNDTFRLVDGLAGQGSVSIESCDSPGFFMVHSDGQLNLQQASASSTFSQSASWYQVPDLSNIDDGDDLILFRAFSDQSLYVRHRGNFYGQWSLELARLEDSNPKDLSFRKVYVNAPTGLPCDGVTGFQDEVFRFALDEGHGDEIQDLSTSKARGVLYNGPRWIVGKHGAAVDFNRGPGTQNQYLAVENFPTIRPSTFTVSFWALPDPNVDHEVDRENPNVIAGLQGQRYVIYPVHGSAIGTGRAGVGVSVGANGVSVYAHAANFLPCLLAYQGELRGWTHVAVVFQDDTPRLYINGVLVRRGIRSPRPVVAYINTIGNNVQGTMAYVGALDEIRVDNRAYSQEEIEQTHLRESSTKQTLCADAAADGQLVLDCPDDMAISTIDFASFGQAKGDCHNFELGSCHSDITALRLQAQCTGRQRCVVPATAEQFGDPCSGLSKSLVAQFTCRSIKLAPTGDSIVCSFSDEYDGAQELVCPAGSVVKRIDFASYGTPQGSCGAFQTSSCHAATSQDVVANMCVGRNRCTVPATNQLFGDPCFLTPKYLHIQATCGPSDIFDSFTGCASHGEYTASEEVLCPAGLVISSIDFASYGTPTGDCGSHRISESCHAASSKEIVESLCLGKQRCTVAATNSLFGDPCPLTPKELAIQYTCRTFVLPSLSCVAIEEDTQGTVTCPEGTVISDVLFASYGRPTGECSVPEVGACHSENSVRVVQELCLGQRSCDVSVSNTLFGGDPCQGTSKQLFVKVACSAYGTQLETCKPITECGPGQYEASEPTPTSDRICQTCKPGFFKQPQWPVSKACVEATPCKATEYEDSPPTATTDRVCRPRKKCGDGTYVALPASPTSNTICASCDVCPENHHVATPCSETSNTVCKGCTVCKENEYEESPCSDSSDTVCQPCTPCGSNEYQTQPCTSNQNTKCAPLTVCTAEEYETQPSTSTSDRICRPLTTCSSAEFVSVPATATSDRRCSAITLCEPGQTEQQAPTPSSDRRCQLCPEGTADVFRNSTCIPCKPGSYTPAGSLSCSTGPCQPGSTDHDSDPSTPCRPCDGATGYQPSAGATGQCLPVKDCKAGEQQSTSPTAIRDRSCSPCVLGSTFKRSAGNNQSCVPVSQCPAGSTVVKAPTLSSDRRCDVCPPNSFKPDVGQAACQAWRVCSPGQQETTKPSTTSDRECEPCDNDSYSTDGVRCLPLDSCGNEEYETEPPTPSSNRKCKDADQCQRDEYEAQALTSTSNRVCKECSTCGGAQHVVKECDAKSDRVCDDCDECIDGKTFELEPCEGGRPRVCESCTVCNSTQFQAHACRTFRDTDCRPLTECKDDEYEASPPTDTSDRVCFKHPKCKNGEEYEAEGASPSSPRVCRPVSPPCPPGFEETAPTATSDRKCKQCQPGYSEIDKVCVRCPEGTQAATTALSGPCQKCPAGTADIDSDPATPCQACQLGKSFQPKEQQTFCADVTACPPGEEVDQEATLLKDRTCKPCKLGETFKTSEGQEPCQTTYACPPGWTEYHEATLSADRTCAECQPGTFKRFYGKQDCLEATTCQPGQELVAEATKIQDAVCRDCHSGSYDHDGKPETPCRATKVCHDGSIEMTPPTATSNRECWRCDSGETFIMPNGTAACASQCAANQMEAVALSPTSDRLCAYVFHMAFDGNYQQLVGNRGSAKESRFKAALISALSSIIPAVDIVDVRLSPGSILVDVLLRSGSSLQALDGNVCATSGIAISLEDNTSELRSMPCGWTPTTQPPSTTKDTNSGSHAASARTEAAVYALIAIAAICLVVAALLLLTRRKKASASFMDAGTARPAFSNPTYDQP